MTVRFTCSSVVSHESTWKPDCLHMFMYKGLNNLTVYTCSCTTVHTTWLFTHVHVQWFKQPDCLHMFMYNGSNNLTVYTCSCTMVQTTWLFTHVHAQGFKHSLKSLCHKYLSQLCTYFYMGLLVFSVI